MKHNHKKLLDALKGKKIQYFPDGGEVQPSEDEGDETDESESSGPPPSPLQPGVNPSAMSAGQSAQAPAMPQDPNQLPPVYLKIAQAKAAELTNEDRAFKADIDAGYIKPKTFDDYWNSKQDLPGKIGSFLGLLIGGAGAGLSHQPNIMMGQINQWIQNDLEAQKSDVTNRQNLYKLTQREQLNQAQIKQAEAQTGLFGAETQEAGVRANTLIPAQTSLASAQANNITDALATFRSNRIMVARAKEILSSASSTPAQKAEAAKLFTFMDNEVDNNHLGIATTAGMNEARYNYFANSASGQQDPNDPIDESSLKGYKILGQMKNGPQMGGMSDSDYSKANDEAALVRANRAMSGVALNAFDQLNDKVLKGVLTPGDRTTLLNSISGQIYNAASGRFNANQIQNAISSFYPAPGDLPKTLSDKRQQMLRHFQMNEAGSAPTLTNYGLLTPFRPTPPGEFKNKGGTAKSPEEGETRKVGNETQKMIGGVWHRLVPIGSAPSAPPAKGGLGRQ